MEIPETIASRLLEYQKPHVENLMYSLDTYGRVLDASDTGTGKTFTAIATCKALKLKPLIICPKAVLSSWKKVISEYNCKYYGLTNYESIQNCKIFTKLSLQDKVRCIWLRKFVKPTVEEAEKKKKKKKKEKEDRDKDKEKDKTEYLYEWSNYPDDIIVIFDEAHKCKSNKTINNNILYAIARTNCKIMLLSATIADKEQNFALAGYTLKLYPHPKDARNWIEEAGRGHMNPMIGVHNALTPEHMTRMKIKDLGDLFPENQILAECYDMECAKEIEEQYELIQQEVENLKNKEDSSCALAYIMYARMRIEQLRVPTFIEMAKKFLEENNAVAIFVNFTASLKLLAKELQTNCLIYGEQTLEERQKNIDDFNTDASQIIIVNIRSGGAGISLHDTIGDYPRISIVSPSWSAQDILQALGRIHRANGKTAVRQRIVYCKGTIEEDICNKMKEKIQTISSINEGNITNYKIEGLFDDEEAEENKLSDFEVMFMKIQTLNARKKRLEDELKKTENDIRDIEKLLPGAIA